MEKGRVLKYHSKEKDRCVVEIVKLEDSKERKVEKGGRYFVTNEHLPYVVHKWGNITWKITTFLEKKSVSVSENLQSDSVLVKYRDYTMNRSETITYFSIVSLSFLKNSLFFFFFFFFIRFSRDSNSIPKLYEVTLDFLIQSKFNVLTVFLKRNFKKRNW